MKACVNRFSVGMLVLSGSLFQAGLAGAASPQDVVVPVPSSLTSYGKLEVVGQPGAGQDNKISFEKCTLGADGRPLVFGCKAPRGGAEGTLNTVLSLSSGYYLVFYGNTSSGMIEIQKDQKTILHLSRIQVPHVSGNYQFKVFNDLSDRGEQDTILMSYFMNSGNQAYIQGLCADREPTAIAQCAAWNSPDFRSLRGSFMVFGKDGGYSIIGSTDGKPLGFQKDYITDPKDGEFVSVFPGVYGIEFLDTQSGESSTQLGIRVN